MPKTEKPIPAYIPWGTLTDFLKHLKSSGLVPSRIDKSIMGYLPALTRGQLVSALRFLGLIGQDGSTSDGLLKQLVGAHGSDNWTVSLKQHIVPRYKDIIGDLKPDQATPQQLAECFRRVCDKEMMRIKSERFYLALLTDAGIPFSPHLVKRAPRSGGTKTKKPAAGNGAATTKDKSKNPPPRTGGAEKGTITIPLYLPNKIKGEVIVPDDLDDADCDMIDAILRAHAKRRSVKAK